MYFSRKFTLGLNAILLEYSIYYVDEDTTVWDSCIFFSEVYKILYAGDLFTLQG